jgi:hypothetical protein
MNEVCSSHVGDSPNGILGNTILMMGANPTEAQLLLMSRAVVTEYF